MERVSSNVTDYKWSLEGHEIDREDSRVRPCEAVRKWWEEIGNRPVKLTNVKDRQQSRGTGRKVLK